MREFGNICFHHKGFFGYFSRGSIGHDTRIASSSALENLSKKPIRANSF